MVNEYWMGVEWMMNGWWMNDEWMVNGMNDEWMIMDNKWLMGVE